MEPVDFFNSVDHLAPKCPGCHVTLDYGLTTKYNEKYKTHVCMHCGAVIK